MRNVWSAPPASSRSASVPASFHRYVYPNHSPSCLVRNRVSIHFRLAELPSCCSTAKLLTRTVRSGKFQPRVLVKPMVSLPGKASLSRAHAPKPPVPSTF